MYINAREHTYRDIYVQSNPLGRLVNRRETNRSPRHVGRVSFWNCVIEIAKRCLINFHGRSSFPRPKLGHCPHCRSSHIRNTSGSTELPRLSCVIKYTQMTTQIAIIYETCDTINTSAKLFHCKIIYNLFEKILNIRTINFTSFIMVKIPIDYLQSY